MPKKSEDKKPKKRKVRRGEDAKLKEVEYMEVRLRMMEEFITYYYKTLSSTQRQEFDLWIKYPNQISLRQFEPEMSKFMCVENQCYIHRCEQTQQIITVNPLALYNKMLTQYTKYLFDIVARHTPFTWTLLSNGETITTSYCQFHFVMFAHQFGLFSKLRDRFEKRNLLDKPFSSSSLSSSSSVPTTTTTLLSSSGKQYYMRKNITPPDTAIVFDCPQIRRVPFKTPIPDGKNHICLKPVHLSQEWQDVYCQQVQTCFTVQPLTIQHVKIGNNAWMTQPSLHTLGEGGGGEGDGGKETNKLEKEKGKTRGGKRKRETEDDDDDNDDDDNDYDNDETGCGGTDDAD